MLRAIAAVALVLLLVGRAAAAGGAQRPPNEPEPTRIINLGHVQLWSVPPLVVSVPVPAWPTASPKPASSPTPRPTPIVEPLPPGYPEPVSLDDARALVDFPLLVPTWLPWPQDEPTTARVFQRPGRIAVHLFYADPAEGYSHAVSIHQRRWADVAGPLYVTEELEEIELAGSPAAIWTVKNLRAPPPYALMGAAFERDELLVELFASGLSRDDLIRIVESLAVPPPTDAAGK